MLTTLQTTLYIVVAITFIVNLQNTLQESKKLKAAGKTPLTSRNITTLILAAIGEALTVYLILLVSFQLVEPTQLSTGMVFVLAYVLRNAGAYVAAWATWEVFVRIDKRKMSKQIEKDQGAAL